MSPSEKLLRAVFTMKRTMLLALFLILATGAFRADAADAPIVRANYAAFSGAFAPLWIAADNLTLRSLMCCLAPSG